ncbi:MAG: hypothetical protein BECKG1743D_GA0114223_105244 [Candidatus Kentron sp. G]|nr:MAG: hypothetical protein BECKG1743E_GA0114224_104002 [Candidatus Kentron sp. G]VFN03885.1 MAG: hypothetical protein BECKG1743D_GA0114223_105244 [Candidatus Kentron sp. G]
MYYNLLPSKIIIRLPCIVPGPETEARIRGCRDPEQLDTWIGKATTNEWQQSCVQKSS